MLLAGVSEKFIGICLEYYGSDPCHYFSSPGLSWNAMLSMTNIAWVRTYFRHNMYLFVEQRMRGGMEAFLTLLKDTVKLIINTWNIW